MKRILLLLSLLLAPSAFADDLVTSLSYSTSTKQVQAQTRANGWVNVQTMQKQYVVGTAYANGTPTITATGWTTGRGVYIPYQTSDGAWRMRLNVAGTITSTNAVTVTLSGVTFTSAAAQSLTCTDQLNNNWCRGYTNNGGTVLNGLTGTATTSIEWSGDVELASKPTWAD